MPQQCWTAFSSLLWQHGNIALSSQHTDSPTMPSGERVLRGAQLRRSGGEAPGPLQIWVKQVAGHK